MRKLIGVCLLLLSLVAFGCGRQENKVERIQTASYPNWVQMDADGQASFSVPPELTMQTRKDREQLLDNPQLDPLARVWLQQQEKTDSTPGCVIVQNGQMAPIPWEDTGHYAWVEFKTIPSREPLPKYGQNLGLNGAQIQEFGRITQESLEKMESTGLPDGYTIRFLNWKPMESVIINGVETLHNAFDVEISHQGKVKSFLHGERWTLMNRDRIHTLTVVWNKADDGYWQTDEHKLTNIINTLQIKPSQGK